MESFVKQGMTLASKQFANPANSRAMEEFLTAAAAEIASLRQKVEKQRRIAENVAGLCLYFLVNNYPEHAALDEPCDGESMCRECEEGGCVELRMRECRAILAPQKPSTCQACGSNGYIGNQYDQTDCPDCTTLSASQGEGQARGGA